MRQMSDRGAAVAGAVAGYLSGSVSFSRIVGQRVAPGADLSTSRIAVDDEGTTIELRGITPTSVHAHGGARAMLVAVGMEAAKAAIPTAAARALLPGTPAAPAAAFGALVGHIAPVWSRFRGGYGVSAMLGGTLALDPVGLVVTAGGLSGVMRVTDEQRLMLLWPITVPVWGAVRGRRDLVAYGVAANLVYWARLLPELNRGLRPLLEKRRVGTSAGLDITGAERERAADGEDGPETDQDGR
ncbi:MAG TPA: glycerol-3-phosphate acyltransferase [Dermatophilaceae bacterium]|nr:glycerol-3-phosphate acyltransferase [Dermatophilaceae bacterium]